MSTLNTELELWPGLRLQPGKVGGGETLVSGVDCRKQEGGTVVDGDRM